MVIEALMIITGGLTLPTIYAGWIVGKKLELILWKIQKNKN